MKLFTPVIFIMVMIGLKEKKIWEEEQAWQSHAEFQDAS